MWGYAHRSLAMKLPKFMRAAIEEYIPPLDGWTLPDRACEMAELVLETKPQVVVEIGTFGGRSAIAMAFALRQNNNGGHIYCIDPWRLEHAIEGEWDENQKWWQKNIDIHEIHRKCMVAIWGHNIEDWLVVIRSASQYCHQLFPSIDLLLIDGNHSEVASLRDAQLYVPKIAKGGYCLMDDADWQVKEGDTFVPSTKKAMQFIEESCDLVRQSGNMRIYKKR